jgi:hypothetical protein
MSTDGKTISGKDRPKGIDIDTIIQNYNSSVSNWNTNDDF